MQKRKNNFLLILTVFLLGGALLLSAPTTASASRNLTRASNGITVTLNASRPLIGNPRGSSFVSANSGHNNSGMAVSTSVFHATNGTLQNWSSEVRVASAHTRDLLALVCSRSTATVTGTTRSGTVMAEGSRRVRHLNNFQHVISLPTTW